MEDLKLYYTKKIRHCPLKGSVAINGVSLTISKVFNKGFEIVVIPKTLKFLKF